MRKIIMSLALCALLFTGCGKSDIAKTYEQSEQDGIIKTYYEMKDGTWLSKSLYSSSFEDIKVMEGSLIVEMIY